MAYPKHKCSIETVVEDIPDVCDVEVVEADCEEEHSRRILSHGSGSGPVSATFILGPRQQHELRLYGAQLGSYTIQYQYETIPPSFFQSLT